MKTNVPWLPGWISLRQGNFEMRGFLGVLSLLSGHFIDQKSPYPNEDGREKLLN